jgi:hypothetical protein
MVFFAITCGMELVLKKCSLFILQLHTIIDPEQLLISFYEEIPQIYCLPLFTQGTICYGRAYLSTLHLHPETNDVHRRQAPIIDNCLCAGRCVGVSRQGNLVTDKPKLMGRIAAGVNSTLQIQI